MEEAEEEAPEPLARFGCSCSSGRAIWSYLGLLDYFPHNPPAGKSPIRSPDVTQAICINPSGPRPRLSPRREGGRLWTAHIGGDSLPKGCHPLSGSFHGTKKWLFSFEALVRVKAVLPPPPTR